MRLLTSAKRLIIKLLGWIPSQGVYRLLRRLLRRLLPDRVVNRIPVVGDVQVDLPGGKRIVLKTDGKDSIASSLFWNGSEGYEPELFGLFTHILKGVQTVLDVGAHTGLYGLIAAATDPAIRVYAFEPDPRIFEYLRRNVEANAATNVVAERMAVSDRSGELTFYIPQNFACLPLSASSREGFRPSTAPTQVPATTVDDYVRLHDIRRVDLMKIDTESTEHLVLQGATATLDRDHPMIVCEVLYGLTEKALHALFDPRPYVYFHITEEGLIPLDQLAGDPSYTCRNVLFIHESDVARISGLVRAPEPVRANLAAT